VENRWGGLESGVKLHGAAWRYWFVVGPPTCASERRGSDSHAKLDGLATHLGSGGSSSVGAAQTGGVITAVAISSWLVSTLCCVSLVETGLGLRRVSAPLLDAVVGCHKILIRHPRRVGSLKDADMSNHPSLRLSIHRSFTLVIVSGAMSFLCSWLRTLI
jgi:hypothetical protein